MENHLLNEVLDNELIIILWQNDNTVVIGRNQNAYKECNLGFLQENDVKLARRITGGGAVYHDLGNLNFSFISKRENEDISFNLEIIKSAILSLGLNAETSGRNDLTIDGFKFSGNAFYHSKQNALHHGTIMINVNKEVLSKALNVDQSKLKAKGVDSVRSRVKSLSEHKNDINVESVIYAIKYIVSQVAKEAGNQAESLISSSCECILENDASLQDILSQKGYLEISKKFASTDWIMGKMRAFEIRLYERFSWGDFDLNMNVNEGKITDVSIFSDDLDVNFSKDIEDKLVGTSFSREEIQNQLSGSNQKYRDVCEMLLKADIF